MPAVMNRSEAFWWAISLRKEVKSMVLMAMLRGGRGPSYRAQRGICWSQL
jgi:hypothetical protein